MTDRRVSVALPGGLWRDRSCHRTAELRPLTGRDDEFLLETGGVLSPAERVTELLERCVGRLGDLEGFDRDTAGALSVGDREALLLQLRRLTVGDGVECLIDCPECGATIEFELDARTLLEAPGDRGEPPHHFAFEGDGELRNVSFRLPTGADQEAVVAVARHDPARAAELLLERCVVDVRDGEGRAVDSLPEGLAGPLAEAMAELDPQAAIDLAVACGECGATVATPFDVTTYVLEEAAARGRRLEHEVHALALTYHWSEADIVAMAPGRRRRYLALATETDLEALTA